MAGADAEYTKRLGSDWWRGQTHPGVSSTSDPSVGVGRQKAKGRERERVDSEIFMQDAGCSLQWLSLSRTRTQALSWFATVAGSDRTNEVCAAQ